MSTGRLWEVLAWFSLPVLGLLAACAAKRKLYREFPFFFAYVLAACLVGVVRFVVYKECSAQLYFYVFWCSDFVLLVATFLALYETFLRRIFPVFFNVRLYRFLFPAAGSVIAFLAFLTALHSPNKHAAFLITSRVFDFLRSAVIGFFVFLVLLMGREFSGYEFSIACGFGLQAAAALVNSAVKTRANYKPTILDRFETVAYDIACLIWLVSFSKRPKPVVTLPVDQLDSEMLHQARTWETLLKDWLTLGKTKR
jgi:hypothetical protein